MQDYPDAESWPYLDKLICAWRKKEEETRKKCGLKPAPPYGRCELFRGQNPTQEWVKEAGGNATPTKSPTESPTKNPTRAPVDSPTRSPVEAPTRSPQDSPTRSPQDSPTRSPQDSPTRSPTETPTRSPEDRPTRSPTREPTRSPIRDPTSAPTDAPVSIDKSIPPEINCRSQSNRLIQRMCDSNDPCCNTVRADTNFCWDVYDNIFPGDQIKSACYHCCEEKKIVGEATPINPKIPQKIRCSDVDNPFRMCKDGGCCETKKSRSNHCNRSYAAYAEEMESICVRARLCDCV